MDDAVVWKLQRAADLLEEALAEIRMSRASQAPAAEESDREVLTVKDVMERYKVSKAWVHKHLEELPTHRGGPPTGKRRPIRFYGDEMEEWWHGETSHRSST